VVEFMLQPFGYSSANQRHAKPMNSRREARKHGKCQYILTGNAMVLGIHYATHGQPKPPPLPDRW